MDTNWLVVILLCIVAAVVFIHAWWSDRQRLKAKRKRFTHRESLTPRQIYLRYYKDTEIPEEEFRRHWIEIAHCLQLGYGELRPTDRFDTELRPCVGKELSDEIEDVTEYCELEVGRLPPRSLETIDDVIRWLVIAKQDRLNHEA